jgi:hypothetical protein
MKRPPQATLGALAAFDDANLLAGFQDPSWDAWRAFLAAAFALPMSEAQLATYRECTGRVEPPTAPAREAFVIAGRRSGKTALAAAVAVYLAAFRDYAGCLRFGERATVPIIAADRAQARVALGYVVGLIEASPLLAARVTRRTAESVRLGRVSIEVHTANYRLVRGYTVAAAVLDEVAVWRNEDSANPDREILNALRPAMATVPGALLVAISSPYARRGVLWDAYRKHWGRDGDVLVWKAASTVMNPTLDPGIVTRALEDDPEAARAEYLAEFRSDVEAFVSREAVDACVVPGRLELPPVPGVAYRGFVDPSGGSADSFTLAIAHGEDRDGQRVAVLDVIRERKPPFSPEDVVAEYAALLKAYGVTTVVGDRYAGEWPREAFRKHGVEYQPSARTKSDLYRDALPLLNSGSVELLDVPRLHAQLLSLERRTARGGRDSIDHPPNGHDDAINAAAGALLLAAGAGDGDALIMATNLAPEPVRRRADAPMTYAEEFEREEREWLWRA